ncbi:hypothetical protein CNBG_0203 [Cryptococcus deuterogattii R265]|uniref:F-box domain-containing protein n=1 Tax=Cryptococcus deuterogattii (strain R265) TaxID=294750 RepID=A0A095C027_CRYD2|nr:hypothetical protein CNBG_0203 [Cryptococcus deuterogattii R265]KIR74203.1 hypothetical protein I310_01801 [Cryptococcus deuterogattii CA1014]KIS01318.1 hypothetical protein L804_01196 [Cryptococcus deuterogattii 2001/935-1]
MASTRPTTSIARLPPEIQLQIIHTLKQISSISELINLLCTCRFILAECESRLYERVELSSSAAASFFKGFNLEENKERCFFVRSVEDYDQINHITVYQPRKTVLQKLELFGNVKALRFDDAESIIATSEAVMELQRYRKSMFASNVASQVSCEPYDILFPQLRRISFGPSSLPRLCRDELPWGAILDSLESAWPDNPSLCFHLPPNSHDTYGRILGYLGKGVRSLVLHHGYPSDLILLDKPSGIQAEQVTMYLKPQQTKGTYTCWEDHHWSIVNFYKKYFGERRARHFVNPSSVHSPIFTFVNVDGSLDHIRNDIGRQLREMELEDGLVEAIQNKMRLVGVGDVFEGGCEVCGM